MGYSELHCHICGCSFNVARLRTASEPRSEAWASWGRDSFVNNSYNRDCTRDSGCALTWRDDHISQLETRYRSGNGHIADEASNDQSSSWHAESLRHNHELRSPIRKWEVKGSKQTEGSLSWLRSMFWSNRLEPLQSDDDCEASKYEPSHDSGDYNESDDEMATDDDQSEKASSDTSEADHELLIESTSDDLYQCFIAGLDSGEHQPAPTAPELMLPLFRPQDDNDTGPESDSDDYNDSDSHSEQFSSYGHPIARDVSDPSEAWEHIPGPNCKLRTGYNGNQITSEEMRGCCTAQCLVPKIGHHKTDWLTARSTESWEDEGDWFFGGVCDFPPSRDMDRPWWQGGCTGDIEADDSHYHGGETSMAFHPACFEVFKRAFVKKFGNFDINALGAWFNKDLDASCGLPRHEAVGAASEQWWEHNHGDEWIVANPCLIPGLRMICQDVSHSSQTRYEPNLVRSSANRFLSLPQEIYMLMFEHLSTSDVAVLAVTVPRLRSLANSFLRAQIHIKCPYLWELSPTKSPPYSQWIFGLPTPPTEKHLELEKDCQRTIKVLEEEGYPELASEIKLQAEQARESEKRAVEQARLDRASAELLPRDENESLLNSIDFVCLVLKVDSELQHGRLKGLRNRKRIWDDCMCILKQIEHMEEAGEIKINRG